jgi:hypothetical protein
MLKESAKRTALRERLDAAKLEAQAPQSGWHGFEKAFVEMLDRVDLLGPILPVSSGVVLSAESSPGSASMTGTWSISKPTALAMAPANAGVGACESGACVW